jgi:tRNA A-37 threonylcarbamoyl transferase component Bud32
MSELPENATRLARGATADVYAWGDGRILKLFHERVPIHANEISATRVAHEAGLPVPAVLSELIEVDQREGIVFERIEGPTLLDYLNDQPEDGSASTVEDWARQTADLHARIHSTEVSDLPSLAEILHWSIQEANPLDKGTRQAVLDLLHGLPDGNALCHNDYYPRNLIVSGIGTRASRLLAIDWAIGTRGNPLADHARTWLISRMWVEGMLGQAPDHVCCLWQCFWKTYFCRYGDLRPHSPSDLIPWQAVTAAASLCWDGSRIATEPRVSLVQAALDGSEHPWLYRRQHDTAIASAETGEMEQ